MLERNSLLGDLQETAEGLAAPPASSSSSLEMMIVLVMVTESWSLPALVDTLLDDVFSVEVGSVVYIDVLVLLFEVLEEAPGARDLLRLLEDLRLLDIGEPVAAADLRLPFFLRRDERLERLDLLEAFEPLRRASGDGTGEGDIEGDSEPESPSSPSVICGLGLRKFPMLPGLPGPAYMPGLFPRLLGFPKLPL